MGTISIFPLWFEFCTLVGCFRIIPLVMHALNGKHIPYALNDDDDELDENDSDDVFNEDNDGNDDDDDHHHHHHHHCP